MTQKSENRRLADHPLLLRQSARSSASVMSGCCATNRRTRSSCGVSAYLVATEFGWADTARFALKPQKTAHRTEAHAKSFGGF
jgi:hypothetical protein